MLVTLLLWAWLIWPNDIPDWGAMRQGTERLVRQAAGLLDFGEVIEVGPNDSLQYRGPRDGLDGWTEGPVVG